MQWRDTGFGPAKMNLGARAKAAWRFVAARRAEQRFAVRVVVAAFLSFVLAGTLGLPQGYWVVLTAVIVMQNNLGGSLKAATDRLLGTLTGAFAGFVATLAAANGLLQEGLVIALVLAPLAFLSAANPSFKIAPVTAIIVVLSRSGHEPALWLAVERVAEILLGGVIGVAVALFVLPARAQTDLAERVGAVLSLLAEAWNLEMASLGPDADTQSMKARLQAVNDRLRVKIVSAEAAGEDARRERAARLTEHGDTDALLRTLRRVRHDFILVGRATATPWPAPVIARLKTSLGKVTASVELQLNVLAAAARSRTVPPQSDAFIAAIDGFGDDVDRLRADPLMTQLAPETVGGLFTLGFAFEELRRELPELGNRLAEFAAPDLEHVK
ncbi:FUSC family protein [Parvibaculum sp.]|uniref:FUSC family protein n=1 Tax=Parvibaculum sp. TaxID=2024848 RepID=UPI002C621FBF|nr:FUSC family protein [Parvibaculum sp.]HUD51408.1 FUSC family protein [Parvibaculum sp.]